MLDAVADAVIALPLRTTVRVGIDGIDGAGKTTFADHLGVAVAARGRQVIRAGVDGFHNPRSVRYRLGRTSAEGYFRDSYDYAALRKNLLDPLGPGGDGRYRVAVFDHVTDRAVDSSLRTAPTAGVLIFDGIFLHRPELSGYWDYSVFLQIGAEVSFARLADRDGFDPDPSADSNRRYLEGQRLYLATCAPASRASVVIDNNDCREPRIL